MTTAAHILLAEDDPNLGEILREYLEVKGFRIRLCRDGEIAQQAFETGDFDLLILDVMMPRKDGFTLAREIRRTNDHAPILFLTARDMIEDKVEGFSIGGDDYLTKPFSMEELLLRIRALLRRRKAAPETEQSEFGIGSFTFDPARRELSRADDDVRRLTSRESDLLRLLCLHKGRTLSRSSALRLLWGDDSYFNARSMDVFITRLRKYLKADPEIEIQNVHGEGFRLICP